MAVPQIGAERVFVEHRGLLHAVAYRVLGSVTEAEDVVQDASPARRASRYVESCTWLAPSSFFPDEGQPLDARLLHVNGGPGIVIYSGRTPVLALTLHLADGVRWSRT